MPAGAYGIGGVDLLDSANTKIQLDTLYKAALAAGPTMQAVWV